MTRPRLGVVTVVHGRHEHLALQAQSLARSDLAPDVRVVVTLDDDRAGEVARASFPDATVVPVVRRPGDLGLPVAAGRNLGARTALDLGAERLVFLDVDCLVAPGALAAYADVDTPVGTAPEIWCGPVTYLAEVDRPYALDRLADLDRPHPGRPDPGPGGRATEDRWELFWSLSFALDAATWARTGGFDEAYSGYGGEDTDFGQRARAAGCTLTWLGDARAYHQWHPSGSPPVHHRDDIVRNANLFHDRWGWTPMGTWLEQLADLGLVEPDGDRWRAVDDATVPAPAS